MSSAPEADEIRSGFLCQAMGAEAAALFAAVHQASFAGEVTASWGETDFVALLDMKHATGLVGMKQGSDRPEGVILYRVAADEAEIVTLGILPEFRRSGLASFLLGEMFREISDLGVRAVFLEVAVDNAAAQKLYDKLDFQHAGLRKDYFLRPGGGAIDALVLRREI